MSDDRLEQIRHRHEEDDIYLHGRTFDDDIEWLLDEVDRLRADFDRERTNCERFHVDESVHEEALAQEVARAERAEAEVERLLASRHPSPPEGH